MFYDSRSEVCRVHTLIPPQNVECVPEQRYVSVENASTGTPTCNLPTYLHL